MDNKFYNIKDNRGDEKSTPPPPPKKKKNKMDFKKIKKNTICSLNEVEGFLNNFNKFCDYIKLYKILK